MNRKEFFKKKVYSGCYGIPEISKRCELYKFIEKEENKKEKVE